MIIYEVNVAIQPHAFTAYYSWLQCHINEMLTFSGFQKVQLFRVLPSENETDVVLSIHYHINSIEDLNDYLQHHAEKMRKKALEKFPSQFKVTRRILSQQFPYKPD